jgi:hypothetical protein
MYFTVKSYHPIHVHRMVKVWDQYLITEILLN